MQFGKPCFRENNELLNALFAQKKVLICAHRGSWHGNVTQNTTLAYQAALMQGADILETDTTATTVVQLLPRLEATAVFSTRERTKFISR